MGGMNIQRKQKNLGIKNSRVEITQTKVKRHLNPATALLGIYKK